MRIEEAKNILNENGFILKERFVNVDEIRVPEWLWVAYETGNTSNLEDEEIMILHIFEKDHKNHQLEANDEPNFYPTNDVTDEGDMCYTVQVFEDRLVEDYNFYRNRYYQMNRKRQEEKRQELERLRASFCDNPNRAKIGSLTSPYNGEAVYGNQMWDDGVPVMKYWYRDNKTIAVTLKEGTPCIVLLDKYGEDAQDVWVKYRRGWLRIDGVGIEVEF